MSMFSQKIFKAMYFKSFPPASCVIFEFYFLFVYLGFYLI